MTRKSLLVLNAGSSSLKFSLFSARPDGLVPTATGVASGLTVSRDVKPGLKIKCSDTEEVVCHQNLISPTHEAALSAVAKFTKSFTRTQSGSRRIPVHQTLPSGQHYSQISIFSLLSSAATQPSQCSRDQSSQGSLPHRSPGRNRPTQVNNQSELVI
eukprot:sb/3473080/